MSASPMRHPMALSRHSAATAVAMFECWWVPTSDVDALSDSGGESLPSRLPGAISTCTCCWRTDGEEEEDESTV